MRVSSSNAQSLQFLQAQQAFAGRAKAPSQDMGNISATENQESLLSVKERFSSEEELQDLDVPTNAQWREMAGSTVEDVQQMASDLGYVGLSRSAIERAMVRGESLLADYRA